MFKILMLSKINILLTSFVNNTDNVFVNDLAYYFFFIQGNIYDRKNSGGLGYTNAHLKILQHIRLHIKR